MFSFLLLAGVAFAAEKKCLSTRNVGGGAFSPVTVVHGQGAKATIYSGKDYKAMRAQVENDMGYKPKHELLFIAKDGEWEEHYAVRDQESFNRAKAFAASTFSILHLDLPETNTPTMEPTDMPTSMPTEKCRYRYVKYENVRVRNPTPNNKDAVSGNHFCIYAMDFFKDGNKEVTPKKVVGYYPTREDGNTYAHLPDKDVATDDSEDSHWCNRFKDSWGRNEGWIEWDFGESVQISNYMIAASHQWNYPSQWKMLGSHDGKRWEVFDEVKEGEDFTMCNDCGLQKRTFRTDCASPTPSPTMEPTTDCLYRYIKFNHIRLRTSGGQIGGATTGNHFCLYKVDFMDSNGNAEPAKVIDFSPTKAMGNNYVDLKGKDEITDDNKDTHWCNHRKEGWGKDDGFVVWDMGKKVKVSEYMIGAHHQWNYPSVWQLLGSNTPSDINSWEVIDYVDEKSKDNGFDMCKDCGYQERTFKTNCNF